MFSVCCFIPTHLQYPRPHANHQRVTPEYIVDLFAPAHPSHHGFAVLVSRHDELPHVPRDPVRDREFVVVRAMVYLAADKTMWKLLWESQRPAYSILNALQSATMDLEREMGKVMGE